MVARSCPSWPVLFLISCACRFPSRYFYNNLLLDGEGINEHSHSARFHQCSLFAPFVLYDCTQGQEQRSKKYHGSLENLIEADLITHLLTGEEAYCGN